MIAKSSVIVCALVLIPSSAAKPSGACHPEPLEGQLQELYLAQDYSGSVELLEGCLTTISADSERGPRHPDYAGVLNLRAFLHRVFGELEEAERALNEAVGIVQEAKGEDAPEQIRFLAQLAEVFASTGRLQEGLTTATRAHSLAADALPSDHPTAFESLRSLASVRLELGDYAEAERLYRELVAKQREVHGPSHLEVAVSLDSLAGVYLDTGNLRAAEPLLEEALEIVAQAAGKDDWQYGSVLNSLGIAYLYQERSHEAWAAFEEVAPILAKTFGERSSAYSTVLHNQAGAARQLGRCAEAEKLFSQSLEIKADALSERPLSYARSAFKLGQLHLACGDIDAAGAQLSKALGIVEKALPPTHAYRADILNSLGVWRARNGENEAALERFEEAFAIQETILSSLLGSGAERARRAYFRHFGDEIPLLIWFAERAEGDSSAAWELAFEAVLRRKGRLEDGARSWLDSARAGAGEETQELLREWEDALACEASLLLAQGYRDVQALGKAPDRCPLAGGESYRRLIAKLRNGDADLSSEATAAFEKLRARRERLAGQISRRLPRFRQVTAETDRRLLQAALGSDELLIEIVRVPGFDAKELAASSDFRYGAFLLRRPGAPQWVDLGPAGGLDPALRDLLQAASDWSVSLANQEPQAAAMGETAEEILGEIAMELSPLLARLSQARDVRRIRIAPDGMLNLLPFEALPAKGGERLLERFELSYVAAGRDLAIATAPIEAGPPVIALSPGAVDRASSEPTVAAGRFRAERLERLESAELEAQELLGRLRDAEFLPEGAATEQRLKQLRSPRLLHIAGHGLVRGNEDCAGNPDSPACDLEGVELAERAMSLSAIVLEEAYGRGTSGSVEDGLLTALELQTLHLRGTEMLVLSQCRMAEGAPVSGEGVYGMRRAADIAGVRTFVAPLWRVADSAQRQLMESFYQAMSSGQSRAAALRTAKLQLLRELGDSAFLYWAPVILTGDPSPLPADLFVN